MKMCSVSWFGVILLGFAVFAVVCESSQTDLFDSRQDEVEVTANKRPFFVGSRYGRSNFYGPKTVRGVNVVPRNDRFFLGSRYGKRSEEFAPIAGDLGAANEFTGFMYMSCTYTGVKNFYRCYKSNPETHSDNGSQDHLDSNQNALK